MEIRPPSPVLARDPGQAQKNQIRVLDYRSSALTHTGSLTLSFLIYVLVLCLCPVAGLVRKIVFISVNGLFGSWKSKMTEKYGVLNMCLLFATVEN